MPFLGDEFALAFGWSSFFESHSPDFNFNDHRIGRVISEEKNLYKIQTGFEEVCWGEVSGRFYFEATRRFDFPATGDWVACVVDPHGGRAIIHKVFPRRTCIYRKSAGESGDEQILAANVDTVFIVTSLNGDLNLRRLERYLVLCRESQVEPVILLNKSDLVLDPSSEVEKVASVCKGVAVHAISVHQGLGMDQLQPYLRPGKTVVVLGSSGVGKSSLVNLFLGQAVLKTQDVRERDDKGKHTTTARYIFRLESGGLLIDTPGMRELQLLDHGDGFSSAFEDIENLMLRCRFSNCTHESEPQCAVQQALTTGELDSERWRSYGKLQRELAHQERKQNKALASEDRQKWKRVHKQIRAYTKNR